MELWIIALSCTQIILIFILLFKRKIKRDDIDLLQAKFGETIARHNQDIFKGLSEFKESLGNQQGLRFETLRDVVEKRLDIISEKVQKNLSKGLSEGQEVFTGVIERLAKIDEAQKKIEGLSQNVVDLQDILTDKKSRGVFGEVQLNHILKSVFGEKNGDIYEIQKSLSNGKIVDVLLKLPQPLGNLPIDSKFPLENYKKMLDSSLSIEEKAKAKKLFKENCKKHIDDIALKYLSPKECSGQAILFLPAEAIFAELHAYHYEIIEHAQEKNIWVSSPTTLMATLTTVQTILLNLERNQHMSVMHEEINKLGIDFERYESRWNDLAKHIGTVSKDVEKIHTTSHKISDRFQKIMNVEIDHQDK